MDAGQWTRKVGLILKRPMFVFYGILGFDKYGFITAAH
jgi:hypothetical protein